MSLEQRKYTRVPIEERVELRLREDASLQAACVNISRTGLLCETDAFMSPRTTVALQLNIPFGFDSYNFRCEGIVVRSDRRTGRYLIGLQFSDLPTEDSQALDTFLRLNEGAPRG